MLKSSWAWGFEVRVSTLLSQLLSKAELLGFSDPQQDWTEGTVPSANKQKLQRIHPVGCPKSQHNIAYKSRFPQFYKPHLSKSERKYPDVFLQLKLVNIVNLKYLLSMYIWSKKISNKQAGLSNSVSAMRQVHLPVPKSVVPRRLTHMSCQVMHSHCHRQRQKGNVLFMQWHKARKGIHTHTWQRLPCWGENWNPGGSFF